jgi:hypothetical protein
MSSETERRKRLDDFRRKFGKDIDEIWRQQDKSIKQSVINEFNYHMNQAEEWTKRGDKIKAMEHELYARLLNDKLSGWE